jgi:hypothetical protein
MQNKRLASLALTAFWFLGCQQAAFAQNLNWESWRTQEQQLTPQGAPFPGSSQPVPSPVTEPPAASPNTAVDQFNPPTRVDPQPANPTISPAYQTPNLTQLQNPKNDAVLLPPSQSIPAPPPPVQNAPIYVPPGGSTFSSPISSRQLPGGISLSKAAAERIPLNLSIEGAIIEGGRIVLSGRRNTENTIDAALFLTALRASCEDSDPYFSLDPDDLLTWINETNQASEDFYKYINSDLNKWTIRKGFRPSTPSILAFHTISASRDYPRVWNSILGKYPNLKSRLVFRPEWLRQTRFGEILYKADVLLKELGGGAPMLGTPQLRASAIGGYISGTQRIAARTLLSKYHDWPEKPANTARGRIWYDLSESSEVSADAPESIPPDKSELYGLLARQGLLDDAAKQLVPASLAESGGALDLSAVFPRMYVRVVDPVTHRDGTGNFPGLNELTASANKSPEKYAAAYKEFQLLVEAFRAYLVAVHVKKLEPRVCTNIPGALLDSERTSSPLPDYHPTDFALSVGWYEYSDRNFRRAIGGTGGLFQGGVSIGATRYLREFAQKVADTPVIQELRVEVAKPIQDFNWKEASDRQFIAFNLDLANAAPVANSAVTTTIVGPASFQGLRPNDLPVTVQAPRVRPASWGVRPHQFTSLDIIISIGLIVWLLRYLFSLKYRRGRRAVARETGALSPIEVDFNNAYKAFERAPVIARWMKMKRCSRLDAMRFATEDRKRTQAKPRIEDESAPNPGVTSIQA